MFNGPCTSGQFPEHGALTGVVFGNGASLDRIPDSLFRKLECEKFLTVGVNQFGAARRVLEAGFNPDIYFVWDQPKNPFGDRGTLFGLWTTTAWRVTVKRHHVKPCWPCDQYVKDMGPWRGMLEDGLRADSSVTDGAVNLLYKMGVRTVYLYGVDCGGNYCETVTPRLWSAWTDERMARLNAECWRQVCEQHHGMRIFCATERSPLLKYMPFGTAV